MNDSKKAMLDELHSMELFKKLMSTLGEEEQKRVSAAVDSYIAKFAESVIAPLAKNIGSDELRDALRKGRAVADQKEHKE